MNWADDSMKLLPESQSHSQMVGHLKWNIKNEREKCYWECGVLSSDCDFCQPSFACCVHDIKQIYYTQKNARANIAQWTNRKRTGRNESTAPTKPSRSGIKMQQEIIALEDDTVWKCVVLAVAEECVCVCSFGRTKSNMHSFCARLFAIDKYISSHKNPWEKQLLHFWLTKSLTANKTLFEWSGRRRWRAEWEQKAREISMSRNKTTEQMCCDLVFCYGLSHSSSISLFLSHSRFIASTTASSAHSRHITCIYTSISSSRSSTECNKLLIKQIENRTAEKEITAEWKREGERARAMKTVLKWDKNALTWR